MPHTQLALPQQCGRFILMGALTFFLCFWALAQMFISGQDAHLVWAAVRLMCTALLHQPFAVWFSDFETAYVPFFLRQHQLVACYLISFPLSWLAAFLFDIKILRKENLL